MPSRHASTVLAASAASTPASTSRWSSAFDLRGGDVACLLVHGFTATPQEMRFLGERLHASGYTIHGARVAGHATSVEELEQTKWQQWYASVEARLGELRQRHSHVVVVGQSMGSLLALSLAAQHPEDVAAVALLAPAVVLQRGWLETVRPILPLVGYLPSPRLRYLAKGISDIADPSAHAERECYDRMPIRALNQLLLLQRHVRRQLPLVRQPALVVHAHQDHTCSPRGVEYLQERLGGPVEVVMLPRSYHVVSVDFEREQVAELVADFTARSQLSRQLRS